MKTQLDSPQDYPRGHELLKAAGRLGADLAPAFRLLMLLPDTRGHLAGWFRHRAAEADPAVGVYLEAAARESWDDLLTRMELLKVLDLHHPHLARRTTPTAALVIRAEEGYWTGSSFTRNRRFARWYSSVSDCRSDLRAVTESGVKAMPEFLELEELWRGLGPMPAPAGPDPWGAALGRARVAPGCAWIPVSPAVREELERYVILHWWFGAARESCEEVLRTAARFGHPLCSAFLDLASRQGWKPELREELARLDALFAPFRDPPGALPALAPLVGPYCVVCSRKGFWDGARWARSVEEAEKFPAWREDQEGAPEAARKKVEELTGVACARATVAAHPAEPAARGARGRQRAGRPGA